MSLNRAMLEERYKELASHFVQLGAMLRESAEAMENSGRPLPYVLFDELQAVRRDFEGFSAEVLTVAQQLAPECLPPANTATDLLTLEPVVLKLCEALDEAERRAAAEAQRLAEEARKAEEATRLAQQRRAGILNMLARVAQLFHKTREDFQPLHDCKAQAERLSQTIVTLNGAPTPVEEKTLSEAQMPFQALLRLAEEWNNLDGDDWDNLREEVAGYFGKELAAQAARGQLIFKEQNGLTSQPLPPAAVAQTAEARPFESTPVRAGQQAGNLANAGGLATPVTNAADLTFDWNALEQELSAVALEQAATAAPAPVALATEPKPAAHEDRLAQSPVTTATADLQSAAAPMPSSLRDSLGAQSRLSQPPPTQTAAPKIDAQFAENSRATTQLPPRPTGVPNGQAAEPYPALTTNNPPKNGAKPGKTGLTGGLANKVVAPPSAPASSAQPDNDDEAAEAKGLASLLSRLSQLDDETSAPAATAVPAPVAAPLASPEPLSSSPTTAAATTPIAQQIADALHQSGNSTLSEAALSHWSKLLEELSAEENQKTAQATAAPVPPVQPNEAPLAQQQAVTFVEIEPANQYVEPEQNESDFVDTVIARNSEAAQTDSPDELAAEAEALLAALRQRPLSDLTEIKQAQAPPQSKPPLMRRLQQEEKEKQVKKQRANIPEPAFVDPTSVPAPAVQAAAPAPAVPHAASVTPPVAKPPAVQAQVQPAPAIPQPPIPPPLHPTGALPLATPPNAAPLSAVTPAAAAQDAAAAVLANYLPAEAEEDSPAEALDFEDYATVPQGFEDEDEKTQSFYYVSLEERKAPFFFADAPTQPLYNFQSDLNASHIALAIENGAAPERLNALRDLQWRLLFEEQLGLAFFLTRSVERQTRDQRVCLPSWLIRSLVTGKFLRYDEGELAQLIRSDLRYATPVWMQTENRDWNCAFSLLLGAAALRPALLAPSTRAPRTLKQLPEQPGLKAYYNLCQTIGRYCNNARPLDLSSLKNNQGQSAWQEDLNALRREVELWWKQAPFREMEFAPATYVWRNWVDQEGALRLLLPVHLPETCDLAAVKRQIKQWTDERQIRREINHTDRELIGRSLGQKDIDGDSFKQILDASREAVDLARRWVALIEGRPGRAHSGALPAHFNALQTVISQAYPAVLKELEQLAQQSNSIALHAALNQCRKALAGVAELFVENASISDSEPKIRHILYAPLLASNLPVNWRWKPETQDQSHILTALIQMIAKGLPVDWKRAFAERSEGRDHEATHHIIQYLESDAATAKLAEDMRRDRDQMLLNCRAVLRQEIEETRKQIVGALDFGYVPEKDYLKMAALIDGLETTKFTRFGPAHILLQQTRESLGTKRELALAAFHEKLKLSHIGTDHYYYQQIQRVLERGDLVTAEDYLGMVLDQQELPETDEARDSLASFYPEKVHELSEHLKQLPLYAIIQRARAGADLCGLRLKDYDLEMVAAAISAWFNSRRMQAISEEEINQILPFLGLQKKELTVSADTSGTWVSLTIEPLNGRDRAPVPAFGSEAKGNYRILCVWDRPTEEELLQRVGDTSLNAPVIVFYFGQMNDEMRPALARLCRERRQTFIVIDDVLILYLYGQRAPRLRTLFECTLPFTWTEPYTATSVSPEMFYGRVQERKSIISPTGSGFVYGGRRLGKTALLRDVERNFHDPEKGRLAIFFDLEGENIGTQRQLDDLWLLLGEELKRHKVVTGAFNDPVTLLEQTTVWLEANPARRILLLLDQADRFLEADEKEQFVRASRLRGIMEKTNRRFKVVFAGVHNIPRMTRIPDHPLAQFGTPISIGPLLGHEAHEARKLIEEPMATLGYTFESPDLVRRMLWRTNYYPSLIQHYCFHLLKYLASPKRHKTPAQIHQGPPYTITSEDVDEAYRSQDMRAAIRAGLLLTLQVDERYSVIAYAMADALLHNGEECLAEGHSSAWIAQQAQYWWPDGFQTLLADNSLPVLLDEMVGLGILRPAEKGYALRSKGVAVLLGNEDQITAELQRTRKTPPKYNPSTFRAARTGSPRRSPLTAQEMIELRSRQHGVSLIFGNEAASLPDLREFMEVASPRGSFIALDGDKQTTFQRHLAELPARAQDGTLVLMVCPTCDWDERWVEQAVQQIAELPSQRSFARIAFIADPAKTWKLVNRQARPFELLPGKNVTTYSLKPWHDDVLRQWLDDRSFNIDEAGRERVTNVTGNWPMLLEYFYQRTQIDSFHWMEHLRATSRDLKDKPVARDLARALGLDQSALNDEELTVKRVLLALETGGEQSVELLAQRLAANATDIGADMIKRVLWWAELLSLATRLGPRWRLDHLVGRLLKTVGS